MRAHLWRTVRRSRRRSVAMLMVGALGPLLLAGCGGSRQSDGGSPGVGGTLTIGINRELGSLNQAIDSGLSGGGFVLFFPYATLVGKNSADGTFAPGLAKSFGYVGEGNKTYELKLRPDAKFADGTPVDAEAVKTWLTYFPTAGGPTADLLKIASIDTPDDLTVRLNLATPSPLVSQYLSGGWGMVASPKAVADPVQLTAGAPGAGPYAYDRDQTVTGKGATYTLVPNKYYYDQAQIKWSKIVVKVIDDPATMLRAVQSGQLDIAMGGVSTLDAAKSAGIKTSTAPGGWTDISIIDANGTKAKALGDVRVRQALNYAIDRKSIAASLFRGAVEPTSEFVTTDGFDPALQDYYPYDPAKAKQLLAEAGYPDGFTLGLVAPTFGALTGTPLTQAVAQNLADVGVKLNIVAPSTNAELFQKFLTESAYLLDNVAQPTLTWARRFLPGATVNVYHVVDPEMNRLIDHALTAPEGEQPQLAQEIAERVVTQAYLVPIATNPVILYSTDKVSGVKAAPWLVWSPMALDWTRSS